MVSTRKRISTTAAVVSPAIQLILQQIDAVLAACKDAPTSVLFSIAPADARTAELVTRITATIDRLTERGSAYRTNAASILKEYRGPDNAACIPSLVGILRGLRADYAAGYLQQIEQLVEAGVFSDFLEMAEHLLGQKYKDPAAVLVGGVLEEHLRKLCTRNKIAITAKGKALSAATMNDELMKASVYSGLEQKSVTSWLDLRNKAAHGKYAEYSQGQVAHLLQGVRGFIIRNP